MRPAMPGASVFKPDGRLVWISFAFVYNHAERHTNGHSDSNAGTYVMHRGAEANPECDSKGNSYRHIILLNLRPDPFEGRTLQGAISPPAHGKVYVCRKLSVPRRATKTQPARWHPPQSYP